jgi:hypothetical protein
MRSEDGLRRGRGASRASACIAEEAAERRGGGLVIVSRVCVVLVAAGVLAVLLSACSRPKAPDVGFLPTKAVAETADAKAAFEAAKVVCLEEARRKGIASVTRILLLRGKVSKSDYVDCMELKGFSAVDE